VSYYDSLSAVWLENHFTAITVIDDRTDNLKLYWHGTLYSLDLPKNVYKIIFIQPKTGRKIRKLEKNSVLVEKHLILVCFSWVFWFHWLGHIRLICLKNVRKRRTIRYKQKTS